MDVSTTQPEHSAERQTKLSLLLGIVIWFLHQNTVYALTSLVCRWGGRLTFSMGGISELQVFETIITFITMLLFLLLIYLPWRNWRQFQSEKPVRNPQLLKDTEKDRRPLLAFVAMLLNSLFLLFVIAALVPIFALNPCGQA